MANVIGILATIASLTIIVLGFPMQIIKNYRRKSCEGFAKSIVYTANCTYFLWTIYAWAKPDQFLKISQTPGCIVSLILLYQLFHYRTRKVKHRGGTGNAKKT